MKKEKKEILERINEEISRRECNIDDLSKKYEIDILDIYKYVRKLKENGDNISITQANDNVMLRNFGSQRLIDYSPYPIKCDKDTIKMMFISDTRYGSKESQPSIVNDALKKAYLAGVDYIFHLGDITEGVYSNTKEIYNDTLFLGGFREQADYVIDNYPELYRDGEPIKTYFLTGERDASLNKKYKSDIGKEISDHRPDMIYLNPMQARVEFTNSDNNNKIKLLLTHGNRTQPYTVSYHLQQMMKSQSSGDDKPDILAFGHEHSTDALNFRDIHGFMVPSMCNSTMPMREKRIANTIGAWLVEIKKNKDHSIAEVRKSFIPYYDTKKNDYEKTKVLKLGRKK